MTTYVCELPTKRQEEIRDFLIKNYHLTEEDLDRAMNSKLDDVVDLILKED